MTRVVRLFAIAAITGAGLFGVGALSRVPYPGANARQTIALVRLSWRTRGDRLQLCRARTPEELARLPAHMRTPEVCAPEVTPYRLRVHIDGALVRERVVAAAGARADRPLYVFDQFRTRAGAHLVDVEFTPADNLRGAAGLRLRTRVELRPNQILLITHDPAQNRLIARTSVEE